MRRFGEATLGFLGCGNMGSALLEGLTNNGYPSSLMYICEMDEAKRDAIAARFKTNTAKNAAELFAVCDAVILAIKPQALEDALKDAPQTDGATLTISILAGKTTRAIQTALKNDALPVCRAMPNTPAVVGAAMTALSYSPSTEEDDRRFAETVFAAVGKTLRLDESLLDIVTGISGCGPAYAFLIAEAAVTAGTNAGLSAREAKMLIAQTFFGAGKMLLETDLPPETLRKNVTSPNGATEQGVRALLEHKTPEAVIDAIERATARSVALNV